MPDALVEGEALYHSPRGLGAYQVDGIVRWATLRSLLCAWDTGTGKSHLALAGGALLVEHGDVELVVIVCEKNKVPEWVPDFEEFTRLEAVRYHGTPKKREALRAVIEGGLHHPQVIVTTYETTRNDLGKFSRQKIDGRTKKVWVEGPLAATLRTVAARGGLAIVFDESSKLGNRWQAGYARKGKGWVPERGSTVYRAWEHCLGEIRKITDRLWVTGMTATKVERSPENFFNMLRLVAPDYAGTVAEWERNYVRYRDPFGRASFKNLSPDDFHREAFVVPFSEKIAPVLSYKAKTDPDVKALFPEMTEEPRYVTLTDEHLALYRAIEELEDDPEVFPDGMSDRDAQVLFGIKRMVAAHPLVLAHSPAAAREGTLANLIVERVGYDVLSTIKVAKIEALVEDMRLLVDGQGAQALVFTFFGPTLIPILKERLEAEGFTVATYYGAMGGAEQERAMAAFRAGEHQIMLASDAAARGLNIPEAQYVWNYEMCLTHAKVVQRVNRVSRLGSGHASVTAFSMIALDTIEERILDVNFQRQTWEEYLTPEGDEDPDEGDYLKALTADERRRLFERAAKRTRRKAA